MSPTNSVEASDYETPATSVGTTPNREDDERIKPLRARPNIAKANTVRKRGTLSNTVNAPEPNDSMQLEADADLATLLQAEEYETIDATLSVSTKSRQSKRRTADTLTDHESYLSDVSGTRSQKRRKLRNRSLSIQDSEDDDLPLMQSRRLKSVKVVSQTAIVPTKLGENIEDSESELSSLDDYDMEEDSYDLDDDDEEDMETTAAGLSTTTSTWRQRMMQRMEDKRKSRALRERGRLEAMHPEIKTMWKDLEMEEIIKPVPALQPDHINRKLKPFQLEGLDWMRRQELTHYRGGLLGDEMGMGKTIQACSLIMSDFPAKSPTLVVVPPVALAQWSAEITDYTSGALKVLVYHVSLNPKCKSMSMHELMNYNVIMVSYSGLESIYRKENKGWARADGIVKEDSILHAIHYHRIILDEAHSIKSRTTGIAKACFALKSDFKWCLSGTPVQNRIGEFFSLLRFLDVRPFACYFCKQCKCAELHWEQDSRKQCLKCNHSGFNHVSVFNQEILNPVTGGETEAIRNEGFRKLRLLTDRIMLRRLKRDHTSSMELPPKEVIIHNEFFGEIERDFSQSIMSNSSRKFDTYVAQGVMLNNYANIFGLIMQMRQVADHPDLLLRRHAEGGQNILVCVICDEPAEEPIRSKCRHEFCRDCAKTYIQSFAGDTADCPRCHDILSIDWDQPEIEQDEDSVKKNSIINRIKMENWTSSTKIEMLVYDLYKLRSKKQTHKSIVFSQFTSMLQLVQWRLQKSGFTTVMLDGSMTPAQRQKSIEYFMNNVEVEVFLVSLKAGGVALNLTEASRVYIIDPWWNPAAEWQSADRCHRIGQRRPCVITRLCIEDSVESRIVLLQEKKANLINGTINNDQVAMEKLTPEDMQFLFRGS